MIDINCTAKFIIESKILYYSNLQSYQLIRVKKYMLAIACLILFCSIAFIII